MPRPTGEVPTDRHPRNRSWPKAPPIEIEVKDLTELLGWVREELGNDYGDPFAPPYTLLIEAI